MAIAVTEKLSDAAVAGKIPAGLVPKRVALLDPAYLKADAKWLGGKWAGELARTAVTKLKARGIIFETLRSSAASNSFGVIGDANEGLLKMTAFRELKPWYFNATQIPEKHGAAVWSYFWEFAYSPATVVGGGTAPSSSATDAATKTMMNSTKKYQHDQGAYTKTPADDTYKSVTK
ncbi:MAG: hypothetical protein IPG34_14230 [Rhodocyclaceae bacterium]|nr:hypothetical protein [Rhodocyclaceae bacterium]